MSAEGEKINTYGNLIRNTNISVLLVDDNKVNQFLGKRILKNLGISNVELCGNGLEALEIIKSRRFDLLLTDVEMPGLNGYELSKAIRRLNGQINEIIIIALTANAGDDDRQLAKDSGINDYLTKPYSPNDLHEIIISHFSKNESIVMEEFSSTKNSLPQTGIEHIYTLFHFNKEDVQHFLMMLSAQLPELTNQMKKGIVASDYQQAFQAAHKLKSPIKLLGSTALNIQLMELTENLRQEIRVSEIPSLLEEITPALESILVMVNFELEKLTAI
jgi:CheY-like chemotaxis protein/HPt (histidine-containing phosphotransfer) domain-containing protein